MADYLIIGLTGVKMPDYIIITGVLWIWLFCGCIAHDIFRYDFHDLGPYFEVLVILAGPIGLLSVLLKKYKGCG